MAHSCNKYEKQELEWYTLIVSQDPTILSVIVRAKDMIEKCLNCKSISIWCWSTAEFVRFLDKNNDLNYDTKTKRDISESDWWVDTGKKQDQKRR